MAYDVTTNTAEFKVDLYFVDGDTRTLTIKNPNTMIQETWNAKFSELNSLIQAGNLFIGDKAGASFGKIVEVRYVKKASTKLNFEED